MYFGGSRMSNYLWNETCRKCPKPAKREFYCQTCSFLRNKAGGHHNFCSEECMDLFKRNDQCWYCGYGGDLIPAEDGFMVCTNTDYWKYSCHQKYLLSKQNNRSLSPGGYTTDDYDELSKTDEDRFNELKQKYDEEVEKNRDLEERLREYE